MNTTDTAAILERATLAAGQWATSNTPIAEALAYRDGFAAALSTTPQTEGASVAEESVRDTLTDLGDALTLTGAQLAEALDFIAPDRDSDQLEHEVTIQHGVGHSGKGLYCWVADYPEEGTIFLDGSIAAPHAATTVAEGMGERKALAKEVFGGINALRWLLNITT
ncbi:hypothetical protein NDK50_08260 [Paraburkholderia bryophila]|uniref:hypothetical protein n=1 Tax=Paraburkholderia bryophila TaxID=420952 RepID=UPI00234A84C1|nr:hypothetical protein [Paraburkholderia bryophila]WCM21430.1 hypothetical protein NDK50_08260 [Paraburkholderia bryophila]